MFLEFAIGFGVLLTIFFMCFLWSEVNTQLRRKGYATLGEMCAEWVFILALISLAVILCLLIGHVVLGGL